jgi:hypothetical protein
MIARFTTVLLPSLLLIASCTGGTPQLEDPLSSGSDPGYEYQIGLGYGFQGKSIQVTVDDREVISIVGTEELEQYAQLLGTRMLASGSSPTRDISIGVSIAGAPTHVQAIDLSQGAFIHIYLEEAGLRVFNTRALELE